MALHDARWRKSSHSTANGDCVEVSGGGQVRVRDSRDRAGPVLTFTRDEWAAFLAGQKSASHA